ncbi:hypothetical protein Tco_1515314 [Tanacetum coccineum]
MKPPPRMDISFPPLIYVNIKDYLIVICTKIRGHDVHRMYVDSGSASNIIYEHFFLRLRPEVRRRSHSQNDGILGRSRICALGAVSSTTHKMIKFPTREGVATIVSERARPLEIQKVHHPNAPPPRTKSIRVAIHVEYLKQFVTLG